MSYRIAYANASGGASFSGRTVADAVRRAKALASLGYTITITDKRGEVVEMHVLELTLAGTRGGQQA